MLSYTARMMDPMFEIPKDRKSLNVGKLCLLLGLTALLYLMIAHEFSALTEALIAPVWASGA